VTTNELEPKKPLAPACERNRDPILTVIQPVLTQVHRVLELGSGTGQHAVYFAAAMPHLSWQTSERPGQLDGIRQWLAEAALPNTPAPIELDVTAADWSLPLATFDAVFTANTLHYMPWAAVKAFFAHLPRYLAPGALLIVYGPFRIGGQHISDSNVQFDAWLASVDPSFAVRDFDEVNALAQSVGLKQVARHTMPANNFIVIWQA